VPKRIATIALLAILLVAAGWAVYRHTRPYDPGAEAAGGISVVGASLTRDRSFYWLQVDLDGMPAFDTVPPKLLLRGSNRRTHEPATWAWPDRPAAGETGRASVRFWLDSRDLDATLVIENDAGTLDVKRSTGIPPLKDGRSRRFRSPDW
jgi:hypothetical protein